MDSDFGAFELKERIGKGAMAMVYRAVQKSLDRTCVLKILYPHIAEDEMLVQRFEREARSAASMRHENIVQVFDCGRYRDMPFIAMEFVEGMDLRQWLDRHGTPPVEMALLMLRDLCRGLEHAHARNIVHRDIKPANIMFTPEGTIKIMDFGLARSGAEATSQMTVAGSVLGTPAYMSPEQALGHAVDARSDIFSAGVLAYELLGGQRPFTGDTFSVVMHAILTVQPPDLATANPLVPSEVVNIVQGMLQKDVTKRFATVAQAREALDDVIEAMALHRGGDLLREYAHNPEKVAGILRNKRLSRHLDQGLYFENMGLGKIDEALLEFRRVLHLDPRNAVAKDHLQKLERQREKAAEAAIAPTDPAATQVLEPGVVSKPGRAVAPGGVSGATGPQDAGARASTTAPPRTAPRPSPKPLPRPSPGPKHAWRLTPIQIGIASVAAIVAGVLIVRAVFPPTGKGSKPAVGPAAASATDAPGVTPMPARPETVAVPALVAFDSVKIAFKRAMSAADSARWSEVLTWAALAKKDTSLMRDPGRYKDRLLFRELRACALLRVHREQEAREIYAVLLKSTPNYALTSRWRTSLDSTEFESERQKLFAVQPTDSGHAAAIPLPPARSGTIVVNVNPASSLLVDGVKAGDDVRVLLLPARSGRREVDVTNALQKKRFTLDVPVGGSVPLVWDAAGDGGTLQVESDPPGATFYLDDHAAGVTPLRVHAVAPTKHNLRVEMSGMKVVKGPKNVKLKAREERTLNFKLK